MINFIKSPRFLQYVGHLAAIVAIAGLNDLSANIGFFNLAPIWVTTIGLAVGQLIGILKNLVSKETTGLVAGVSAGIAK